MKNELSPEQQRHPLFFALGKLEKRMTKDLREFDEERLRTGMRHIGQSILDAVDPPTETQEQPQLQVVNGE